ncbi:MAG: hypothetical protein ACRCST_13765 [Turicibacter sp.]
MKKFEYRLEQINIEIKKTLNLEEARLDQQLTDKLNEYGEEGFRLCGVDGHWYYFVREIIVL